MTNHVRRNPSLRTTRNSENNENVPVTKQHQTISTTSIGLRSSANLLKQGAKRAALSDVSNRVPVVVERTAKSQASSRSLLARPVRQEIVHPVIPEIPSYTDVEDTDDEELEGDMDVDELEIESPATEHRTRLIGHGAPVIEPLCTRSDRLELQRVSNEFVDEWDEWGDISMVQEYADDIFTYLHDLEVKLMPNPNYMQYQNDLEWKMRGILIDWLVQVHARFHLLPETLFLTINYIDRFLSAKTVSLPKLQLVGITAMFLASKYEEIQCPTVAEIVYMVDNGYAADEVLKAERFMVGMLDFELGWPGPMSFLRRISKADDYDVDTRTVAKYILETMLMSPLFIACPPSFAAAIANYTSRAILSKEDIWTDAHVYFSTYTEAQIKPAVDVLMTECLDNGREKHGAIFDKYSDKKHKKVSLFVESYLNKNMRMA